MATSVIKRLRLVKLLEMLRQDSDEEHPLTTQELVRRMETIGIECDRRTVSADVDFLNRNGYEILAQRTGHKKGYYVPERSFSVPELKILIDAVQAASFITEKKTAELVEKLAALGGSYRSEILRGNLVCFNTHKHHNEAIYYNVNFLEEALQSKNKVSFYYFDLNEKGERVYRKEKARYIVDPMALVFHEDNYYLMCYSEKYESIVNYRVDRMEQVAIEPEKACKEARLRARSVEGYTTQVFKMYGGKPETVTLCFDAALIGTVYDKFGESIRILRVNDTNCTAAVRVQVSPTFFGWLFQFGSRMKILRPQGVREDYLTQARALTEKD